MSKKPEFTTMTAPDGAEVLFKDGREVYCPFAAGIPMKSNLGQISVMRMPCTTGCAHANIIGGESQDLYRMTCTGEFVQYEIERKPEAEQPIPPKLASSILSLS
jgi:hypothetical protein